ncbi:MAG: hypothetical protein E4H14_17490 [Candidatus Thorarchaeota archaeon]|nr:MAG: hypothetical protein E4H14_17490 [Candidatus Thorarchaeota archaeon]
MPEKTIKEERGKDGDFLIDFQNPYLDNTSIRYTKARVKSKSEGFVNTNAIGDLFMGSCLHCLLQNFVDRVPRHVKFNKLSGTATDIEKPDEEIIEFHVEVSVEKEFEADLDKVINYLNENGCGMIKLLRKTGMFKVVLDIQKV